MSDLKIGRHEPVLLREAIEALSVCQDGIYVDGTFGRGGHARAILGRLGPKGALYALDRDPEAVQAAGLLLGDEGRFRIERGSFGALARFCEGWGITGLVDGLLLDIGVSSPQLDDPARGFSFMEDGPLDMRMDPDEGPSAAAWLRQADEREIAQVLWRDGEERYARRIARAIVAARSEAPLETTGDLASLVDGAVPHRERSKHPATRTFQALRILINRELDALKAGLEQSLDVLRAGGRLVVICFHSLEDRLVKRFIRANARVPQAPRRLPVKAPGARPKLRAVGKLIRPSEVECHANPRARSALMRVAEVLA
ncbi:MAG: 16S rRNA (cytosine(1402)-N(4))-methyltransferase RsmH [Gammaproteobacteria bacterium]|jgi:16S rRNA (cytosine1402-N4)-methyltransferase|nr:16S rRNA (cytosine(1402)-N(4))-methyltransferase RsmH [Gammaproteobacteria bacterium]